MSINNGISKIIKFTILNNKKNNNKIKFIIIFNGKWRIIKKKN